MPENTTVLSARVPAADALAYRDQAARYGLSTSRALALLAKGALVVDQTAAKNDETKKGTS